MRLPEGLREGLQAQQRRQRDWGRLKARRRWIRKPTRVTRERYLRLLAAAVDGTITDDEALLLGNLSRRIPNAVKRRIEERGLQLTALGE